MLNRLNVQGRLIALASVIIIFFIVITIVFFVVLNDIVALFEEVGSNHLPSIVVIAEMEQIMMDYHIDVLGHVLTQDATITQSLESELTSTIPEIEAKVKEARPIMVFEKDLFDQLLIAWEDYLSTATRVLDLSRQNLDDQASALASRELDAKIVAVQDLAEQIFVLDKGLATDRYLESRDQAYRCASGYWDNCCHCLNYCHCFHDLDY